MKSFFTLKAQRPTPEASRRELELDKWAQSPQMILGFVKHNFRFMFLIVSGKRLLSKIGRFI
jgi:hypothetical protein